MKEMSLKGRVFPADLNHNGDVFGGWIMSKMDKACSIAVEAIVCGKAVTVNVSEINFKKPVHNGNIFTIYTEIISLGNSSITINVDVEVIDHITSKKSSVTTAQFKFVAISDLGNSIPLRTVVRPNIPAYIKKLL